MHKLPVQGHLARVENLRGGLDHEFRARHRRSYRHQYREPVLPTAISLDAAIDSDAVAPYRLDLSNVCAKKFRDRYFHFVFAPLQHLREHSNTTSPRGILNDYEPVTFLNRVALKAQIDCDVPETEQSAERAA